MNRNSQGNPIMGRYRGDKPVRIRYRAGDPVRVRAHFPPGHVRAPYYTRGHCGEVVRITGPFHNAEERAYGRNSELEALYRVRFRQRDLWPAYAGSVDDTVVVDLYEHWLEPGNER